MCVRRKVVDRPANAVDVARCGGGGELRTGDDDHPVPHAALSRRNLGFAEVCASANCRQPRSAPVGGDGEVNGEMRSVRRGYW